MLLEKESNSLICAPKIGQLTSLVPISTIKVKEILNYRDINHNTSRKSLRDGKKFSIGMPAEKCNRAADTCAESSQQRKKKHYNPEYHSQIN